jgi:hypothetical protein
MSRDPETVPDMPSTFKLTLSLTTASAILIGSIFYKEQPAAQKTEVHQQQTKRWPMESVADLNHEAAAEPIWQWRRAQYEACARGVRADYDDDPKQADAWIRTLCR